MKVLCVTSLLLAVFARSAALLAAAPEPEGPTTAYTALLETIEAEWKPKPLPAEKFDKGPLKILCYSHPGRGFYIGAEVWQTINAPIAQVEKVINDADHYPDMFFAFDEIKKTQTTPTGWVVFWKHPIPVPFIPDLRYETTYHISKDKPGRVSYRYQMKEPITLLKSVDGLIVLDKDGEKATRIVQYLFLDGKYGPLEAFAPSKIWRENTTDVVSANLGIKLRAENPAWSRDKLKEEIQKGVDEKRIELCIKDKGHFPGIPEEKL